MKSIRMLLAATAMIAVVAHGSDAGAQTQDPSIGTWKLNLEESRNEKGERYKKGWTTVIRSTTPVLDYTFTGDPGPDGKSHSFSFKAVPDGQVRSNGDGGGTYSMEKLPSGIVDAKLWSPDGTLENKFCIMYKSMVKQICLATLTTKDGKRTMFTNVIDKVSDKTN